jgi:hypothetical protein
MSASTYEKVLAEAGRLDPADQLRLLRDIAVLLQTALPGPARRSAGEPTDSPPEMIGDAPLHSIMELDGLGAEIWEEVDPEEYVRRERASWGG